MRCAVPMCGSEESVELHHLYSRQEGCPDDLVVPLCAACHGRAHRMARKVDIVELTRAGMKRAKAAGKLHGRLRTQPDIERRALRLLREGMSKLAVAKAVGVGNATVYRIIARESDAPMLEPPTVPIEKPKPHQVDLFSATGHL